MPGLEIRIPYVSYKTKTKGFPHRVNVSTTDVTIQENLQYMGTNIQMSPSKQPLNTLNDDLQWSIVDGNTYASIDASSGELTIKEGTITQMVKVRAQSRLNASVFDEKEVVLTYKEQPVIEELNYNINVFGLYDRMIFVSTDTLYSAVAELYPTTTDEYVVFDITEGADKVVIQDVSFINGKTKFTFTFAEPVEEITDIVFRFYHQNNYDIRKDIAVELQNKVRSIMFRNVDAGPYIADRKYKFDYYTDPVLTQRKLDVSLIQGSEYIYQWYDTSVNGTSGTINFVRNNNDVGQGQTVIFKVSDVSTDTSNNISFEFGQIPVHRIDVSGNKNEYINDVSNYYSFTWEEVPNEYQRKLNVSVYDPRNLITYNTSDVSFGKGQFNFKSTSLSAEGDVSVRIYDPNNTLFGQDVLFTMKYPIQIFSTLYFGRPSNEYYSPITPEWQSLQGLPSEIAGMKVINYDCDASIKYFDSLTEPYYTYQLKFETLNYESNIEIDIKKDGEGDGLYELSNYFYNVLQGKRSNWAVDRFEVETIISGKDINNNNKDFPGVFNDNGTPQYMSFTNKLILHYRDVLYQNGCTILYSDLYRIKIQDYDEEDESKQIFYVYLNYDEPYVKNFFDARNTKEIVFRKGNGTQSGQDVIDYVDGTVGYPSPEYGENPQEWHDYWVSQLITDMQIIVQEYIQPGQRLIHNWVNLQEQQKQEMFII